MPDEVNWLLIGDFNLIRSLDDRNRPGGDVNEIFLFNEAISSLGIVELPLQGQRFTWTNKQHPPLLERLDWFFTSNSWTTMFPATSVKTLNKPTSDHTPCLISMETVIPKGTTFRFENYLMEHEHFLEVI